MKKIPSQLTNDTITTITHQLAIYSSCTGTY